MAREIKFRAWNKKLGAWNLSQKDQYRLHLDLDSGLLEVGNGDENFVWEQFTGLKDRNGKWIYEGDIVTESGEIAGFVKWDEGLFTINKYSGRPWHELGEIQVIGNIHENQDLLK